MTTLRVLGTSLLAVACTLLGSGPAEARVQSSVVAKVGLRKKPGNAVPGDVVLKDVNGKEVRSSFVAQHREASFPDPQLLPMHDHLRQDALRPGPSGERQRMG